MSILLLLSSYARPCGILQCDFILTAQSREVPETFSGGAYADVLKNLVTVEKFPYLHDVVASGAYTDEQAEESGDIRDDFDFGLERILNGIEHDLKTKMPG